MSNQLSSAAGVQPVTYSHDQAGNTTGNGTLTYGYNGAGRMVSATQGTTTTYFAVNALGQRVSKNSSGGAPLFAYDEQGHLIGEYTGTGGLVEETVWMGEIPVATLRPNSSGAVDIYYVHTDHLNAPRRVTRSTDNTIVWLWNSDPYGLGFTDNDPDGDGQAFVYNLRLPGQYADTETGLSYNMWRDYDPAVGRYVESDPIGLGGGINTYAYAGLNPLSHSDATGLDYWIEGASGHEPSFHQSLCVGNPLGAYRCFSFGVNGACCLQGEVYEDVELGGPIKASAYRKTNAAEDAAIENGLEKQLGAKGQYSPWHTCRDFSMQTFLALAQQGFGIPARPPTRPPGVSPGGPGPTSPASPTNSQ